MGFVKPSLRHVDTRDGDRPRSANVVSDDDEEDELRMERLVDCCSIPLSECEK